MTQKELLYLEDAIGHEKTIIASLQDYVNQLEDENLVDYMNNELKTHKKMEKDFLKLMEDIANE